jgi:hypothetical protein
MRRPENRTAWLLVAMAVMAVTTTVLAAAPAKVRADAFMPILMRSQEKPYPVALTAPATNTVPPTNTAAPGEATATSRLPTRTPRPTNTDLPTNTPGPSPTPTLSGEEVNYPTEPGTIVMQIGWTDEFAGTFSNVWEEMNGTPWLTVYGDGRIIASKGGLPNREQDLVVGHLDEHMMQLWLRGFAFDTQYFAIEKESYSHPRNSKGRLHFYVAIAGGSKRLSVNGFRSFERYPVPDTPEMPYTQIAAVVKLARQMETWIGGNLSEPYVVEKYTVVVQQEKVLDPNFPLPKWSHNLNIRSVADAAPTAASNYEDHVPGHSFQNQKTGEELRAIVLPEADTTWGSENRAALFSLGGKLFVVGVRQEVPGGSLFLPNPLRSYWYRRDGGPLGPAQLNSAFRLPSWYGLPELRPIRP